MPELQWLPSDETGVRYHARIGCWLTLRAIRYGSRDSGYWYATAGDCALNGTDGKPLRFKRREDAQREAFQVALERCRQFLDDFGPPTPGEASQSAPSGERTLFA